MFILHMRLISFIRFYTFYNRLYQEKGVWFRTVCKGQSQVCKRQEHIYNAESSSSAESDSDEEEVATFCQDLGLLSRSKVGEPRLLQPETVEFRSSTNVQAVCKTGLQFAKPAHSTPGGVTDVNVQLRTASAQEEPQTFGDGRKRPKGIASTRNRL